MENFDPKTFVRKPLIPKLLEGLSEYLKNPANYQEVNKKIISSIVTSCVHAEVADMARCTKCTQKMLDRRVLLKRLGFKNPEQYLAWKKVHEEINKRYPLVNWKK